MEKSSDAVRFRSFGIALGLALALSCVPAKADSFTFSFTNVSGDVSGTVTGEIIGLIDNSTGPATQVLITSFPAGLDSVFGSAPIDATLWDQQDENSFTETDGVITAGGFWAEQTYDSFSAGAQLYVDGDGGFNFLNLDGADSLYVYGDSGLAADNFQSAAPEPSSLLLLGTGLALFSRKFRRF